MNYELVVFDMAGTVYVDEGIINKAFKNAFEEFQYNISETDIDQVMGYEKRTAINLLDEKYELGLSINQIEQIHVEFINSLVDLYNNGIQLQPQPYVIEIFEWLYSKKVKIALNTGFNRKITDSVLNNLKWKKNPFINAVVASDEVERGRPYPFMINKIIDTLKISDASKVVKVGDTEVDILEGKNAKCGLTVAVTTGAYKRDDLAKYTPDYVIDYLIELEEVLSLWQMNDY